MSEQPPRSLILHHAIADGLRDPIRHVKYPDEETCARCGKRWPCPNGAYDDLRDEIKRLEAALKEAQEERDRLNTDFERYTKTVLAGTAEAARIYEQVKYERDEAQQAHARLKAALGDVDKLLCRYASGQAWFDEWSGRDALSGTGWPDVVVRAREMLLVQGGEVYIDDHTEFHLLGCFRPYRSTRGGRPPCNRPCAEARTVLEELGK